MLGLPGRDEDSEQLDHDSPTNTLELLYERLKGGPSSADAEDASHACMGIAKCLEEMCFRAARNDRSGLRRAFQECKSIIAHIDGETEEDGNGE
jgi:hypothetical protein